MQDHIAEMKEVEYQQKLKQKKINDRIRQQQRELDLQDNESTVHKREVEEVELTDQL